MVDVTRELLRIGAIQFGQFETQPGSFAPVSVKLKLIPSYPWVLAVLAKDLDPLVRFEGLTHLLPMPGIVPIGTAVSLAAALPLVYPDETGTIEGAYDFNVPTILLTGIYSDGGAEQAMIKKARPLGLDVKAIVTIIDLGIVPQHDLPLRSWRKLRDLLTEIPSLSPALRITTENWLNSRVLNHR
jgi:orotate phosphoribosyltransferase